jgi:hypothetical protein
MDIKKISTATFFVMALVGCLALFHQNYAAEDIKFFGDSLSASAFDTEEDSGTRSASSLFDFDNDDNEDSDPVDLSSVLHPDLSEDQGSDDDDEADAPAQSFGDLFDSDSNNDSDNEQSDDSLSDGDHAQVQYKLRLADSGKEVYRQWGDGDGGTFNYEIGSNHVIPGFRDAVGEMKVGEEKTVTIPADQAYGSKGASAFGIPGDADLEYTIKVVGKDD